MADVFLDLWGVLTDSRKMTPAYRQRAAEILWSRHGGSIEGWLQAHDVALAWYEGQMADPETWKRGSWVDVVSRADSENIARMFREAKVPPPSDPHQQKLIVSVVADDRRLHAGSARALKHPLVLL